jgi:ribosomal protein S12 methylthiotransferase
MGRKGNFSSYLKIIENIRTAISESVIRSTFLLGFPGEKNKDYLLVEKFLKEANLDWVGFFPYSQEEDTPAFNMGRSSKNFITQATIQKRVLQLREYQNKITEQNLCRFVGKTFDVLAEEEFLSEDPESEEDIILGRGYMNAPDVDGAVIIHNENRKKIKPGKVVKCKITKCNNIDLEAIPV